MSEAVELALSGSNLTADVPFSVALRVAGVVHALRPAAGERGDLARLVADVCARANVQPDQLTAIRLDLGPGSYTGLRVAVTFVRFLQRFAAVRVQAVDSLAWLAARAGTGSDRVFALLDARRDRFHRGVFARDPHGVLQPLLPSAALPLADALAELRAGDRCVLPAALATQLAPELQARGVTSVPAAALLAEELFAADLPFTSPPAEELLPRYLMGSYVDP